MIVGIACMQLVEQGKLALDDVQLVEKIAPVSEAWWEWVSRGLMILVGIEGCQGSWTRKVGAEEEGNHFENAAFAYWLVRGLFVIRRWDWHFFSGFRLLVL
jgi:hypothetical protein